MDKGQDFLRSQVNNAVMQHRTFVKALQDHADQADDRRFRDLCAGFLPQAQQHQRMLEDYQKAIGGDTGAMKEAAGAVLGWVGDLADAARGDDFLRLVRDIVMSRQAEDTFKTFREAGRMLSDQRLADLGAHGEQQHDQFNRDANRLVQIMFVERVRGVAPGAELGATPEQRPAV